MMQTIDASHMYTCCFVRGKGMRLAFYCSPSAKVYGKIWGPTIIDKRLTNYSSMQAKAEEVTENSIPKELRD